MCRVIKFFPDENDEDRNRINEEIGKNHPERNYNMERVSREYLIKLGMEDNRSEFVTKCDQKEASKFSHEIDTLINYIESHSID